MKTQFLNPFIIPNLWITFCAHNWLENFTESKDIPAGDFEVWGHLIYDSAAFQNVHLHVPFNFSNGVLNGCFFHKEL
jgi:hypothetical protein